jgi:pimeloyl-ACP methyl ester carboxylesterase
MKQMNAGKIVVPLVQTIILSCGLIAFSCQGQYKYTPTGKLVDAGGHVLHLHIMGKGKPVVIFENGSGDFSFIWDLVQPSVSKSATTVSYDRAGYAWSEEGPLPRTGKQIAFELHTALHNAGINGPYIMVGQSYGGFLVRSFARLYRKEVVGMVLVDALNENEKILINGKAVRVREMAQARPVPEIQTTMPKNIDTDTSGHINPVASNTNIEPPLDKLSIDDQKIQLWAQTQFSYFKATSNEMDWSPEDVADMYKNKGKTAYMLGNIPLIVLAKGKGYYAGLPDSTQLEKQRLDLQKDLAHLSTNGKLIVDKNSGHNIHLEDPATVINAIKQVILACKTTSFSFTKLLFQPDKKPFGSADVAQPI